MGVGWIMRRLRAWRLRRSNADRPCVLVWGDSNACLPDSRNCWPALLARRLRGVQLFNDSVSGRTSGYDRGLLNSARTMARRLAIYHRLTDLYLALGTNDVKRRYGDPGLASIEAIFGSLVADVRRHPSQPKVTLLLPPPIHPLAGGDFVGGHLRIGRVSEAMASLCRNLKMDCIATTDLLVPDRDLESDGVHLNASGRRRVAQSVYQHLHESGRIYALPETGAASGG